MFPLGSTPSKRPKRRVESYRILYAHILHALSLPGHPLRVTEKATHGEQVGLYSWLSRTGTSITINIVPKCEVCPRDHGKVVESLRGGVICRPWYDRTDDRSRNRRNLNQRARYDYYGRSDVDEYNPFSPLRDGANLD